MAKTTYRYIVAHDVRPHDPVSKHRLLSSAMLGYARPMAIAIRVPVDDMNLTMRQGCRGYYETNDPRTLEELNYDIMVRINWRWRVRNDLKPQRIIIDPRDMLEAEGLKFGSRTHNGVEQMSYLTPGEYRAYMATIAREMRRRMTNAHLRNGPYAL